MTNGLPSIRQAHTSSALNLSDSKWALLGACSSFTATFSHRKREQLICLNTLTTKKTLICVEGKHFIAVSCSFTFFSITTHSAVILNPSTLYLDWWDPHSNPAVLWAQELWSLSLMLWHRQSCSQNDTDTFTPCPGCHQPLNTHRDDFLLSTHPIRMIRLFSSSVFWLK